MSKPKRIYTEEEVARLIRRAVELEAERSVSRENSARAGLSIAELEQIAAGSGIDPELIHQAANELERDLSEPDYGKKEKAKVKKNEIVCEHWINALPDSSMLDELVTELNHRFGTSEDDITWWDRLWDNYAGKAKVRKTSTSVEWHYTDEWEYYTTRVLLQKRGERFRIRVSKRQKWGMQWSYADNNYWLAIPILTVFTVVGGALGFGFLGTVWPGIAAGVVLSFTTYPLIRIYNTRSINKHRDEVTDTADELAELAVQLLNEPVRKSRQNKESKSRIVDIEFIEEDEEETTASAKHRIRNHLR